MPQQYAQTIIEKGQKGSCQNPASQNTVGAHVEHKIVMQVWTLSMLTSCNCQIHLQSSWGGGGSCMDQWLVVDILISAKWGNPNYIRYNLQNTLFFFSNLVETLTYIIIYLEWWSPCWSLSERSLYFPCLRRYSRVSHLTSYEAEVSNLSIRLGVSIPLHTDMWWWLSRQWSKFFVNVWWNWERPKNVNPQN